MLTAGAEPDCRAAAESWGSLGPPGPPSRPAWAEVEVEENSQEVEGRLHLVLAVLSRSHCDRAVRADRADCVDAALSPC